MNEQVNEMSPSTAGQTRVNEFGQPIGAALDTWTPPPFPPHKTLTGRYCQLEPIDSARHAPDLWGALAEDSTDARYTYMNFGPFANQAEFEGWVANSGVPRLYAIVVGGRAVGMISYYRINPENGAIEVGSVFYTARLVQTPAAAEAQFLLLSNAFELGYRRYEWKCDSCNLPSRAAATRLGFTYEGLFRQAVVYRERNRDTTWFSIIDSDWHAGLKGAFVKWLEPSNFDDSGKQRLKLSELTAPFVHARS